MIPFLLPPSSLPPPLSLLPSSSLPPPLFPPSSLPPSLLSPSSLPLSSSLNDRADYLQNLTMQELEEEKANRKTLLNEISQAKDNINLLGSQRAEFHIKLSNASAEQAAKIAEITALKQEIRNSYEKGLETCEILEKRLKTVEEERDAIRWRRRDEEEEGGRREEERLGRTEEDWRRRFEIAEDNYQKAFEVKCELEFHLNELTENFLLLRLEKCSAIQTLLQKTPNSSSDEQNQWNVQWNVPSNFQQNVPNNQLIDQLNGQIKILELRNKDLTNDLDKKENRIFEEVKRREGEVTELKEKIGDAHGKLTKLNWKIEELKNKMIVEEERIEKIGREIGGKKREESRKREERREEMAHLVNLHSAEAQIWSQGDEHHHISILELERMITAKEDENARLKQDYERICKELQINAAKQLKNVLIAFQSQRI